MTVGNVGLVSRSDGRSSTVTEAARDAICQYCGASLRVSWANLGMQPLANDYRADRRSAREIATYPLHARFCEQCFLVQVDRVVPREAIFEHYPYFSSNSASWLRHCEAYAAAMIERFKLDRGSRVIEVASNDGYLLQYFARAGTQVLGIDPASNVAQVAQAAGIPTEVMFFGAETASRLVARGIAADHLSAKNVLAHVPDIRDFARGVATLLKPQAVFTVEYPHLLRTIAGAQFDQIYHEHFTYLSLLAVARALGDQGLRVFDVEELVTHGGSLRVYACHQDASHVTSERVQAVLDAELAAGLDRPSVYAGFDAQLQRVRRDFLEFLQSRRAAGELVIGYGAAAKGNTFLNYCGADATTLPLVVDRSPAKVGRFMPGSGIAILGIDMIEALRPDYVVILPWNLRDEIVTQIEHIREWGGRFVTAIPSLQIF